MYEEILQTSARKQIKKLKKVYQETFISIFLELKEDPYIGKPLTRELTGKYSYRFGVYRIIYTVNKKQKVINITTAGHRSSVYK